VEKLVFDTLAQVVDSGFEQEAIEAALNRIEFQNRELNTGGFPRGLALMFGAVSNWNYGKDPFEALRFDAPLKTLREKLLVNKEPVLEDMVRARFIDNPHKLTVTSKPSFEEGPRIEQEEKERLQSYQANLTDDDIEKLVQETRKLKEIQEAPDTPEALATVPRLEISDIPTQSPTIPTTEGSLGAATVLRHPLLTSGVVYADIAFDISGIPEDLLTLLPLFCRSLLQLGTKNSDFVQLQRRIDLSTGGISISPFVSAKRGSDEPVAHLIMRGKSMEASVDALLALMAEVATEVRWDNKERFVQLAKESHAGGRSQLLSSGHIIAAGRIGRQFTTSGWASEQMSGFSQFEAVGQLLEQVETDWEGVEKKLRELQAYIFQQACVVNLTADDDALARLDPSIEKFLSHLPAEAQSSSKAWQPQLLVKSEGIIVPSQVNYVGKGANLYHAAGYKLHGSAVVTSRLLGTTWLWDRVRVSGGAYGGFCSFDVRSGDFKFLSYRDPNLQQTLDTYDGTANFLREFDIGDDELAKGIIGTMGDIDSHQLPDSKGYTALQRYLLGETDEMRQKIRDEVLSTTAADMKRFADAIDAVKRDGSVCVVGSDAAINEVSANLGLSLRSPFAAEGA